MRNDRKKNRLHENSVEKRDLSLCDLKPYDCLSCHKIYEHSCAKKQTEMRTNLLKKRSNSLIFGRPTQFHRSNHCQYGFRTSELLNYLHSTRHFLCFHIQSLILIIHLWSLLAPSTTYVRPKDTQSKRNKT